jgi:Ni/Fe-hydrogenase 1 B-type cytochrome subunit
MSAPVIGAGNLAPAGTAQPANFKRIYVWEVPVRVYHWVNAIVLVGLCVTGYLIGAPQRIFYANESYQLYWFGSVRFIHFLCAFVYVFVTLGRLYWAFAGNQYARWENFIPHTKQHFENIKDTLLVEMLQVKKHGKTYMGHNTMAASSYFGMFLAFIFQTVTGLALYGSNSDAKITHIFNWIVPIFGGDAGVRFWHHTFLWIFVLFVIVHVYLTIYDDVVEGRGEISAMISGWKFKKNTSGH